MKKFGGQPFSKDHEKLTIQCGYCLGDARNAALRPALRKMVDFSMASGTAQNVLMPSILLVARMLTKMHPLMILVAPVAAEDKQHMIGLTSVVAHAMMTKLIKQVLMKRRRCTVGPMNVGTTVLGTPSTQGKVHRTIGRCPVATPMIGTLRLHDL